MILEEVLPYLGLLGFIISISVLIYKLGKWTEKMETSLGNVSKGINATSEKIDKIPENFWVKFIDAYKLLAVMKSNPKKTRKEELLDKAKNRTISYEESLELKDILESEAKQAQASGDFFKFLIIMGILIFLGAIIADLFKED